MVPAVAVRINAVEDFENAEGNDGPIPSNLIARR